MDLELRLFCYSLLGQELTLRSYSFKVSDLHQHDYKRNYSVKVGDDCGHSEKEE